MDLMILPCYGALPQDKQQEIFDEAPEGCRKLVVATNIAETSLTIDGVRYVVDPGFVKQKQYNPESMMDALSVVPISKSAAKQRAGRAGRTGAGVCVRIYDEKWMEDTMMDETIPEIQRTNLCHTVLSLKGMGIDDVLDFNYMDPPPREMLEKALLQLYNIEALEEHGRITSLGRDMLELPVDPPMARALLEGIEERCAHDVLTVVSLLSAENIFYRPTREDLRQDADACHRLLTNDRSDHLTLLNTYTEWLRAGSSAGWCRRNYVDGRAMTRARRIREQIEVLIEGRIRDKKRSEIKSKPILKSLVAGYCTNCARLTPSGAYRTNAKEFQLAYVHPSSAVKEREQLPAWVMYGELVATSKPYMRQVSAIEHSWIDKRLARMQKANIALLSGHDRTEISPKSKPQVHGWSAAPEEVSKEKRNDDTAVADARARFLARKKKKK